MRFSANNDQPLVRSDSILEHRGTKWSENEFKNEFHGLLSEIYYFEEIKILVGCPFNHLFIFNFLLPLKFSNNRLDRSIDEYLESDYWKNKD